MIHSLEFYLIVYSKSLPISVELFHARAPVETPWGVYKFSSQGKKSETRREGTVHGRKAPVLPSDKLQRYVRDRAFNRAGSSAQRDASCGRILPSACIFGIRSILRCALKDVHANLSYRRLAAPSGMISRPVASRDHDQRQFIPLDVCCASFDKLQAKRAFSVFTISLWSFKRFYAS